MDPQEAAKTAEAEAKFQALFQMDPQEAAAVDNTRILCSYARDLAEDHKTKNEIIAALREMEAYDGTKVYDLNKVYISLYQESCFPDKLRTLFPPGTPIHPDVIIEAIITSV